MDDSLLSERQTAPGHQREEEDVSEPDQKQSWCLINFIHMESQYKTNKTYDLLR